MSGFEEYLEGNYDIGRTQEQANKDNIQAKEINAEIEKMKIQMRSRLINKSIKEKGISVVSSSEIEEIYNEYVNKEEEYLVDGAILQCNQATWDDFPVLGGEPVVLEGDIYKAQKPHTTLCVSENPISSNDLIFATVGDTIKDINIIPFKCNCKIEADRESEIEKIKNDESCSEYGVCRHLMQLNSEWENVSLEGSSYLSERDISGLLQIDNYYLQQVRYGIVEKSSIAVQKDCINMCSILFCKHGGIITPVYSGQKPNYDRILMYEPDRSDITAVIKYIWFFFRSKGLSEMAVAGIMGNVYQECKFNLNKAEGDKKSRFGLFQWSTEESDERKIKIDEWVKSEGLDINLVSTQCKYAYKEMQKMSLKILDVNENNPKELHCNFESLQNASSPKEAARIFAAFFENCVVKGGNYYEDGVYHYRDITGSFERQKNAQIVYDIKDKILYLDEDYAKTLFPGSFQE